MIGMKSICTQSDMVKGCLRYCFSKATTESKTQLRLPLNTKTVVVLAKNGQILFISLYWVN